MNIKTLFSYQVIKCPGRDINEANIKGIKKFKLRERNVTKRIIWWIKMRL